MSSLNHHSDCSVQNIWALPWTHPDFHRYPTLPNAQDCTQGSSLWESSLTPLADLDSVLHAVICDHQYLTVTENTAGHFTAKRESLLKHPSLIPLLNIHKAPPLALAIQLYFSKSPHSPGQLDSHVCTSGFCLWLALGAPASYLQSHTSIMSTKGTKNHTCWMTAPVRHSETGKTTDANRSQKSSYPWSGGCKAEGRRAGHYIVSWFGCWLHVCVVGKNSLSWMHATLQ